MAETTILAFLAGVGIGGVVAAWAVWELALRRRPAQTEIVVTPEVLRQINAEMVKAWLDRQGLMWQPRGLHEVMVRAKAAEQRGDDGHKA